MPKPNTRIGVVYKTGDYRHAITFTPKVVAVIERMAETGLFGCDCADVVERAFCQWLIEHRDELFAMGVKLPRGGER